MRLLAALVLALPALAEDAAYPSPGSKKGLQVQMVEDALELGIRHAAINVQLGDLLTLDPGPGDVAIGGGRGLRGAALSHLDGQVKPLSDAGVVVNFILLARRTGDAARDALSVHPDCAADAPNQLGAFETTTDVGRDVLASSVSTLARRYRPGSPYGTAWGWIVGNEVNSHHWWYNLGPAPPDEVVNAYESAVRIVDAAVRAEVANARVYVSLEHHFGVRYPAGSARQALPGKDLLTLFAARARAHGDFPWHVAFHPYPEDLFDPRTWQDDSARRHLDTPRITFRNLEVLEQFLATDALRFEGAPRRVILSEQGFHAGEGDAGERLQAAAYAYAWRKAATLPTVDALILHRHVDHAHEGGLRLGLWTRTPDSVATPARRRLMWQWMRGCDGEAGEALLAPALEVIGARSWEEALAR